MLQTLKSIKWWGRGGGETPDQTAVPYSCREIITLFNHKYTEHVNSFKLDQHNKLVVRDLRA